MTPTTTSSTHVPPTHVSLIEAKIAEAKEDAASQIPASSEPEETGTDARVSNWRDALPDDLKSALSLAKFKDEASCIRAYLESEKAMTKLASRIAIPKEDASEAEWDTFYKKIGRPDDKRYRPDDLPIGEDEEPVLARYEEILHASGLSKKQGQKVLGHMLELSTQMDAEAKTRDEAVRAGNIKVLETAFGDKMDLKVKQIEAALGKFGTDASLRQELAGLVESTNYHPALVQFLSSVGEHLASDRLVTGDSPELATSKQAALDEIKRLEKDEDFQVQYRGNDFEKRQKAISRMDALHKVAYRESSLDREPALGQ